ncbi:MAG: alpha/beta fold hydrolase [Anaerolineae bacterium]|nr:alpha/beta fold hydrolase [Anaerolineae bacterium]
MYLLKHFLNSFLWIGLLIVFSWLIPAPAQAQTGPTLPRFEPEPCAWPVPANQTVECGYLVVPEDRSAPAGRTIRLAVAILKSPDLNPQPDPLLFLNGGPGSQALHDLPRFTDIFRLLVIDLNRDVIFFDQRGVGLSQPALECPEVVPSLLAQAQGQALTPAQEQAPYLACRDRWQAEGVNLAAYTTAASAADANDLWRVLGYTEVNLFGVSYGTVLAATLMRDYPDGIRSVVLDSAFPLHINLGQDEATNTATYFRRVFDHCTADLLCRTLYPNLDTVFYNLLAHLKQKPRLLTMPPAFSSSPFSFQFDDVALIDTALVVPARSLPALIYDIRDDDYTAVLKKRQTTIENFTRYGPPPGRAMAYSVFCSHGLYAPAPAPNAIIPETAWADAHAHSLTPLPCEQWPAPPERDSEAVRSDIPTLILLGQVDPFLSLTYADVLAQDLSHSETIIVPNTSHNVAGGGGPCPNNLIRSYLNDPTHLPPTDCLPQTGQPVFDTDFVIRAAVMRQPIQGLSLLLGLGLAIMIGAGLVTRYRATTPVGLAWQRSLQLVGWPTALGLAALLAMAWLAARMDWLPLNPVRIVALILPPLAALLAAFRFSPEDEPALEVVLSTSRPLTWLLLERLVALGLWLGGVGLLTSLYVAPFSGEPLFNNILRWLPPLLCLSGLAVYLSLMTRRAIYSLLLVSLLWVVAAVFGDFLVQRWPFMWPLHLYLLPSHAAYDLNRLFLSLVGISLVVFTAPRLLKNEERLLFGNRPVKRRRLSGPPSIQRQTPAAPVSVSPAPSPRLLALHQLAGMIRYECLMQWRRVALPTLGLALMLPSLLGAFFARDKFDDYNTAVLTGSRSLEAVTATITAEIVTVTWLGTVLVLLLMLPLVVADTVPRDQQLDLRELLESLSLGPGWYLTGKVLSLWLNLFIGLGLAALLLGGVWQLLVGPFDAAIYAELWLMGIIPLALINAGLACLLAAWQPSSQRAMLVGGGFTLLCLVGGGLAFVTYGTFWDWLNPARPALLLYYMIGWPGATAGGGIFNQLDQSALALIEQVVNRTRLWQSLVGGAVQVGLVGWLMWIWRKRR